MPDATSIMRTPRSVDISITGKCNLRCTYCSHFTSASDTHKDLPLEDWLLFFEELRRCAVMEVALLGGEPFFRPDLREIIEGIVRNRMRYSITTNGTLITQDMARFIKSTGHCNGIQVSIDGSRAEVHDSCRGPGAFEGAMRGVSLLQANGIHLEARVTIHRQNVDDLENIARLLLEDVGLKCFSTNSASHMGLCRSNADAIQLGVRERMKAMRVLSMLNEKYGGRITASAGPLAEARMWADMERARRSGIKDKPGGGHLTACGCTFNKIAVRCDGAIIPCVQMSHMELGRVNKDALASIWQGHPDLVKLRARRTIPLEGFNECRDCAYRAYCTGNCPAIAYNLTGSAFVPSSDACLKKFLAEGGVLNLA